MDSSGLESRTVQPVVGSYTVNAIVSAKLTFVRLTIKNLCGLGAKLLRISKQIGQLDIRKKRDIWFCSVLFGICSPGHKKCDAL